MEVADAAGCRTYDEFLDYIRGYFDVVIRSHLLLYLRYGISLEGHQQNTVMLFNRDGTIAKVLTRDFSNISIYKPRLLERWSSFTSDARLEAAFQDLDYVRTMFIHTTLCQHLLSVVEIGANLFGENPSVLWRIVKDSIENVFTIASEHGALNISEERHHLFEREWITRGSVRTKLQGTARVFVRVENPLSAALASNMVV